MSATEQAGQWVTDMVVTQLRRAYPDTVTKADLEEGTGIGPGELRAAIVTLEEEGVIMAGAVDGDDGWRYLKVSERALGNPPESADVSPPEGPGLPDPVAGPEEAGNGPQEQPVATGDVGDTRYTATIVLEVSFHPELMEGEDTDAGALREAQEFPAVAADAIVESWPGLPVAASLAKIEAFDSPRRVFPG